MKCTICQRKIMTYTDWHKNGKPSDHVVGYPATQICRSCTQKARRRRGPVDHEETDRRNRANLEAYFKERRRRLAAEQTAAHYAQETAS